MSHHQKHRGPHPKDLELFSEPYLEKMRYAGQDLVYLLNRAYPEGASLKLVGDAFRLKQRQRKALKRAVCSDHSLEVRQNKVVAISSLKGQDLAVDAYNLLITTESALSKGILLLCRDHCYRDIASVHASYRKVEETLPAIHLIGNTLQGLGVHEVHWFFDAPISNSGRLKQLFLEEAAANNWPWKADLVNSPDKVLLKDPRVIVSSDSWVIENTSRWVNFQAYLIEEVIRPSSIKKIF